MGKYGCYSWKFLPFSFSLFEERQYVSSGNEIVQRIIPFLQYLEMAKSKCVFSFSFFFFSIVKLKLPHPTFFPIIIQKYQDHHFSLFTYNILGGKWKGQPLDHMFLAKHQKKKKKKNDNLKFIQKEISCKMYKNSTCTYQILFSTN